MTAAEFAQIRQRLEAEMESFPEPTLLTIAEACFSLQAAEEAWSNGGMPLGSSTERAPTSPVLPPGITPPFAHVGGGGAMEHAGGGSGTRIKAEIAAAIGQAEDSLNLHRGTRAPPEPIPSTVGLRVTETGVAAKDPRHAATARTIGDALKALAGAPVGGLSEALLELAVRAELLERENAELRAQHNYLLGFK